MKKMLILAVIATLALGVYAVAATDSIVWGGSIQGEGVWEYKDEAPDIHGIQSEIYLWASADLADNVMAKVSLKYENFYGSVPTPASYLTGSGVTPGNIALWEGYVKLGKMYDSPVTLVVGRWVNQKPNDQEVTSAGNRSKYVPYYGEGFIINDNGPVDGGKLTYDGDKWWVDLLWNKLTQAAPLTSLNDDNTLYGAYGQYKGIENQAIDAYLLWTDGNDAPAHNQVLTIGARGEGKITPVEGLGYKAELAWTNTHNSGPATDFNGFGGYGGVNYTFTNVQYKPAIRGNFYYLEHNFATIGHEDQYDLGVSGYGVVIDQGSQLNLTNNGAAGAGGFYFANLGATIKPMDKVAVDADYYHYNNAWGNTVLGHEIDLRLSYQYTENVAAELIGGYYLAPGNPTGLAVSSGVLGLPGDSFMVKGGLKVTF